MTEGEAIAALEGLASLDAIVVSRQYHATVPLGDVISVDPPVGTLVVPDQVVSLVISLGPFPASRWTGDHPEVVDAAVSQAPGNQGVLITCFVDLDIPGDRARLNDSGCTLNWDGHNWLGMGQFGSIDVVSESLEVFAQPVVLTLSGVDTEWVMAARETQYKGRDVAIYTGVLDSRTVELLDTPDELWSGYMDYMELEVGQNQGVIRLHCEHRMRQLTRPYRWTDEGQRSRFQADKGFEHLWRIRKTQGKWGTRDMQYGGGGDIWGSKGGPIRNKH